MHPRASFPAEEIVPMMQNPTEKGTYLVPEYDIPGIFRIFTGNRTEPAKSAGRRPSDTSRLLSAEKNGTIP